MSKTGSWAGRIFLFLFAIPFAGFGGFAVWGSVKKFQEGKLQEGVFILLFGLVFGCIGLAIMYGSVIAGRKKKEQEAKVVQYQQTPWLLRPDWAAGKIKSSAGMQTRMFGI